MEERSALARPYAVAAFDQAEAEGKVTEWGDALSFLGAAVSDRALAALVTDPRVGEERLLELLLGLDEDRFSPTQQNFVRLLVENDRITLAPAIAALYERLQARAEGRARVEVISAYEIEPQHQQMLTGAMAKRLGREVELSVRVDPELIGGAIIRTGDVVIDASLRGRLQQLAAEFA